MQIIPLAKQLGTLLLTQQLQLVTAESCTGGGVAHAITAVAGSSQWFERGFVTYSNQAKIDCLGVPGAVLAQHGAVSEATALAMATGALQHSQASVSIAITGIAGPQSDDSFKPVGLVWFAWAAPRFAPLAKQQQFKGDRGSIRAQSVEFALLELFNLLQRS